MTLLRCLLCVRVALGWLCFLSLTSPLAAQDLVRINEFAAVNAGPLADEDGSFSDWIELYCAGTNTVNLDGWYLTDTAGNLKKWKFPATNMPPNAYLVVFASGKNRRVPGAPLHTNFKLDAAGEYLGLIRPDGVTVVSSYSPTYPPQVAHVSYGIPMQQLNTTLLAGGASAKVYVPTNDVLGYTWTGLNFDDSAWLPAQTGVGYEREGQGTNALVTIADSVADWSLSGTQGEKNWFYGYYNKTTDPDHVYQATNFIAFPHDSGPPSANNFWNGAGWDWFNGNPPWDEIDQTFEHPNGINNNAAEHWVIRRWVSRVSGSITVDWTLAKANPAGGGVTGRLFYNGAQKSGATIAGTDTLGVSRSVLITNVHVGDFIDLALDPNGPGGSDDGSDGSTMTMTIRGWPTLAGSIVTDIGALMQGVNSTAYLRIPFVVNDPAVFTFLTLRMQYDDGFVAYLNGVGVASGNAPSAPDVPTWNSTATAVHPDVDAVHFEDFDLTPVIGLLQPGTNILAIHGLNITASDLDFLMLPELVGSSVTADLSGPAYFANPTPGAPNGPGSTNLGPVVVNVTHTPNEPKDNEDLYVTAQVVPTFNAISNVTLTYRVMFSNEVTVPMFDDGLHGDGLAGDGVWGGVIPASASTPGQMVRYFVFARDTGGTGTRFPPFATADAPQYQGTVVFNPALTNPLPVLHWFIQNPTGADNDVGAPCSIYFKGEFRDNLNADIHGQSARGFPKKSYNLNLAPHDKMSVDPAQPAIDSIKLLSTYGDKSYMRNMLAYGSYADADCPGHYAFPVRVQQNNAFFSVANWVEGGDENFLKRLGWDPNGALYKMYDTFTSLADTVIGINTGAEKKTRRWEGNADLVAFFNGITPSGQPLINYVFDNVDVPEVVNFLSGHVLENDEDCCHKNYYFYRDTEGTGEWKMLPWDVDLSFGHTWTDDANHYYYFDPRIYATNCYSTTSSLGIGGNNRLPAALFSIPWVYQMYLRRVRTITDEQFQPPTTHPYLLHYEREVDTFAAQLAPDAGPDLAKWSTWTPVQTLAQAVDDLKIRYFPLRRRWIYTTLVANGSYVAPQPTNAVVRIGAIEYNPASRNQAQEYIQLLNTNNYPVDISGWTLAGAVRYRFRGGVVLPTNGILYVSPDVNAFRARTTGPRGGMGLFIQGNYQGQLSARGELVQLLDKTGRLVQATNYPGNPSPAQRYLRITEIMYHPAGSEDLEYLELKNTGPAPLDLVGVHFTNGIVFVFTSSSAITNLAPGHSALLVRNTAAFQARYGLGLPLAGQYDGALDNAGENLRLDDAFGEKILDFSYDNKWYPITDGFGFSLVIVDETAPWDTWGLKTSWRPSGRMGGSPGTDDPAPLSIPPVLVNELLSNSDPPAVDAVELYNATTNTVDLGGWFITDDFANAFKYRIPNGTLLPAGCYIVFTEADFNPGGAGFAFSSKGDEVYLLSGDAQTNLTGYIHGYSFGAAEPGVTFGRYVTSLGEERFVAQAANTLGTNNAGPKVGPVVISEIMYHPPDFPDGSDDQDDEFIELRNITAADVDLFDPDLPYNTWRVRGGVDFDFPQNVTLGPSGSLLLLSFDPTNVVKLTSFRAKYGVSTNVPVLGPYRGKLNNGGDTIKLSKPAPPVGNQVPYVLVDAVSYLDTAPWPPGADGTGASLQRISLSQYGDDPINWTAGTPSAGAAFGGGSPPVITAQPSAQRVIAFSPVTFRVQANGSAPLSYQWQRNGVNVPGATNAQLTFTPEPLDDAVFSVDVFNSAGAVLSSNAPLSVLIPAAILTQPQGRTVFPRNTNITFSVVAASTTPLRYQWRHDGVPIAQATNSTYTIQTVQPADDGVYTVVVTDDVGPNVSSEARLTVLLHPLFLSEPTSRLLAYDPARSNNTTFSCVATSSTAIAYQWTFNGAAIPGATNTSFTISNVQPAQTGNYAVTATDSYGPVASSNANLTVVLKPTILQQPASQTVTVGDTIVLTVQVSGTEPFWYRWRKNNTSYLWPANPQLLMPNAVLTNAGRYDAIITNLAYALGGGYVQSTNAIVLVVTAPANQSVLPGTNVTVRAIVGQPAPFTNRFLWLFNGAVVAAGTNQGNSSQILFTNDLLLAGFGPAQEGLYTFLISNAVTTTNTVITTNPPATNYVVVTNLIGAPAAFTAGVFLDSDGDGLPDWWETLYGFNPTDPSDAAQDADGDGMTNLQEYLAGTNPRDAQSYLRLEADQAVPGGMVLEFNAVSNRAYAVYYREAMNPAASWLKLQSISAAAVNRVIRLTNAPGTPERYYRLNIPATP